MIDIVTGIFKQHMDIVFLVYGLSFIMMGFSILNQYDNNSSYDLSHIIRLLAIFGIVHGTNELFDMLVIIHPTVQSFKILSWCCMITSFTFLFEFGKRFLLIIKDNNIRQYSRYLKWWITPIMLSCVIILLIISKNGLKDSQIMARYLLAFPGSILTSLGFYYYCKEIDTNSHIKINKYFMITAAAFLGYAILGGLIVPKGMILFSSIVNADNFINIIHVPVQAFRGAMAITLLFSIGGVLRIFNWEAQRKLQDSCSAILESKEQIVDSARVQEAINQILKISLLPISLDQQLAHILNLMMSISWMSLQQKGCIFTCDKNHEHLKMIACHNFSDEQTSKCSKVGFGECLCGLSASTRKTVFSSNENDTDHTIRYDDMLPHGHYCVPITSNDRLLGVINVYLNNGHIRSEHEENFLMSVSNTIAGIIIRKEADDIITINYKIQDVINSILKLSLQPISLEEHLQQTLDIISTVPWLSTKETGCIFIIEDIPEVLVMKAQKGISPKLFDLCGNLPIGKCLCGLVALTGETIFKSCIDEQHAIRFDGMTEHGHLCVPIKSQDKILGVINLYVKEGHIQTEIENLFLTSVANTLAGIIERKIAEGKIERLANYDVLTGLPNRAVFFERLKHELNIAKRYNKLLSIFYIDMDNFKNINDTMGHNTGDYLLEEFAFRLKDSIYETDIISRISGDEFIIALSHIDNKDDIEIIAKKIIKSMEKHFETENLCANITASIGISLYPTDGDDVSNLVKRADIAMYHSKNSGKNTYTFFDSKMDAILNERMLMENELKLAIEKKQLVLYYQPQIDIRSGKISGVEALIRWKHPAWGLVPPMKFIPIAEETGMIVPIGEWVLRTGCEANVRWQELGLSAITTAINLSLRQITKQYNLVNVLLRILYETDINPNHLELEITESFCMQNVSSTITLLRKCENMGIRLAIDDFGTGYSSLSYLKQLPLHKLKIDRSFVKDIKGKNDDLTIIRTVIDMAHNMGLKVIAEGVETINQLEVLRSLDCDEYCIFRSKATSDSGVCRPPVPEQGDQFWWKSGMVVA